MKYDNEDWEDLPKEIQEAATMMGYNQKNWDEDTYTSPPELKNKYWNELPATMKAAATKLGYDEESWNDESDSDEEDE